MGDKCRNPKHNRASLPMSRAFVVQFTMDTDLQCEHAGGRVEHIESGRSQRFGSVDELLAFVTETLEAQGDE